tara:strand:+ start:1910 stop:3817 length:1908 start_codon:yes stop_codon:yes gene_type:complete
MSKKGTAVTNYLKNTMKSLFVGVAEGTLGSGAVVPAIAPIPIREVNQSYGSTEPIEKKKDEEKSLQEITTERIQEVAKGKSLPYVDKKVKVALEKGGIVKREMDAKVAEKEPEATIPLSKYGKSIESIYREGASLLISSSIGFLQTLPASPAKGSVLNEAQRLKAVFGISDSTKVSNKIGLKQKLEWWGGLGAKSTTGGKMTADGQKKEDKKSSGGGGKGLNLGKIKNTFNKIRKSKFGKKAGKFLKKTRAGKAFRKLNIIGKKAGKGFSKVAKQGKGLLKGASKAGKSLLKKGAKKIGAKVGAKALAKVGGKALGKGLLKKIPFVGLGAGLLFAGQRLMAGDMKGALLEAASGIAGTIPGVGTAISVGLDATLAAKDMGLLPDQKKAEEQASGMTSPDPSVDSLGKPIILNPSTMKAWKKAVNAAAKDGVNLPNSVTSSYRSPEQQAALVSAAQAGDPNAISPAQPGNSPHGQGWAVDIQFGSKASEWMREKGKKYGFQWQGEEDPVHFDFINGEENDKWLKPGKNKWLPNVDPVETKTNSSGNIKTASGTGGAVSAPSSSGAKDTLNEEPVTQGGGEIGATGVASPTVVPLGGKTKIVRVPMPMGDTKDRGAWFKGQNPVIDPMGKGVMEVVA